MDALGKGEIRGRKENLGQGFEIAHFVEEKSGSAGLFLRCFD
jgi:hypothetical protein